MNPRNNKIDERIYKHSEKAKVIFTLGRVKECNDVKLKKDTPNFIKRFVERGEL